MITQVGQIMLYVNDQAKAVQFWTEKAGFVEVSEGDHGHGLRWIEIAPAPGAQTTLVLQNKQAVAQMEPGLNLGAPSIMFYTHDLDRLYKSLTARGVTVGEVVSMPAGRVFNFADDEQNYFAVMERQ